MATYNYITNTGLIVNDTSQTRAQVEAEFKAVFGQDLITEPSTPQGVLITRIIEDRDAIARNNVELANQINPSVAGGIFLDALASLTGGSRRRATRSLIYDVVFGGVPSTLIPTGSIAESENGDQFETISPLIIGTNGTITGTLRATVYGEISVPVNSLNKVASSILGWETVTNPNAAVIGTQQESDVQLRRRRRQTLALQTTSVNEAIVSRLYDIEDVHSLYFLENFENTTQTISDITLKPHSIWVCVHGGSDTDIAYALYSTKTAGAAYNGSESVLVTDSNTGRQYEVNFDRPTTSEVRIRVTASKNSNLELQTLIPDLVMNYVNGALDGDVSFRVGVSVSPFEISGAINQQEPFIKILNVELSTDGLTWSNTTLDIKPNEIAVTQRGSISVIIV